MSTFKRILSLFFALSVGLSAIAKDPIYTGTFNNLATGGFDPVSYFQNDGAPVKGSKDYTLDWRGATWRFSSKENLEKFKKQPESFAPQFGGYCAWAIAQGKFAKGDPKTYALVDGKLYLNYNAKIAERWEDDRVTFIRKAAEQYPLLVDLEKAP